MDFEKIAPKNFEWDEKKRFSNIKKHGIDFKDAIDVFYNLVQRRIDDRVDYGEERYIALGQMKELINAHVFTKRNDNIRIISVRKANKKEREQYRSAVE